MESRGEKTELLTTPAVGVDVPDALPVVPGRELVEANRLDREAFERRYGRLMDANGDLPCRILGSDRGVREDPSG